MWYDTRSGHVVYPDARHVIRAVVIYRIVSTSCEARSWRVSVLSLLASPGKTGRT
jgi:hypothetical protein